MKKIILSFFLVIQILNLSAQDKSITYENQEKKLNTLERNKNKYDLIDVKDNPTLKNYFKNINKFDLENEEIETLINENPRKLRPFGINIGTAFFLTAESSIVFLSADYFVLPQLSLEAKIGITDFESEYFSLGAKGYLNSNSSQSRFAPFVGVLFGYEYYDFMIQIPLGLDYVSKKGFNASISLNQLFYFDSYQETLIDFKIGWRFKK